MSAPDSQYSEPRSVIRTSSRFWRYWRAPFLFGAGFCVCQIVLLLVRFGLSSGAGRSAESLVWILSGSALFFVAGTLAGLFAGRLLRGAQGGWRNFLLVAVFLATPVALVFSLAGGLLGPPFVVAYALVPYLLLAGVPALVRRLWLRAAARHSWTEPPSGQVPGGAT